MKRVEVVQLYESLASEKAKRELEAQREARHERAQVAILDKVTTLWPVVLNKLGGGEKGTFAPGAQDLLNHLLANITREEVVRMAHQLPPEKAYVLWEVLAGLIPPKPGEAAGAGEASPATPTEPPPPTEPAP